MEQLTCTDVDTSGALTYSISGGNNYFTVTSNGGLVNTGGTSLDYETDITHIMSISVSDGTRSTTAVVVVTVGKYTCTSSP